LRGRRFAIFGALVALSGTVVACGDDEESGTSSPTTSESEGGGGGAGTITLYSSLPLQGASRPQSEDVIKGIELALKEHNDGQFGELKVEYKSLDDATASAGQWDAAQTKANAREVAQDDSAIAYIGEFNSGASANSIPTLNEANILQVSPSNTALGLTKSGEGAEPGEPEKYYPAQTRTYGRVVPIDTIQGAAQASYMEKEGVTKVYILDDNEVYGKGVAANTKSAIEENTDIEVVGEDSWDGKAANYRALADKIKASGADGVFTGGIIDNNAPQLYKDIHAAVPEAKLFGPDGVATVDFTKEIPPEVQAQTFLTAPTVSPDELPPAGQEFYDNFSKEYGEPADEIDPYAIYGYEAANVILDCIEENAGSIDPENIEDGRQAIIDCFFATENRESPLGTYSIDDDGDTTLTTYGAYVAKGGKLVFSEAIEAE
jgi:branched-chain amino acid transport system substrate-binding protein